VPPERTPPLVVKGCCPNPFNPRLTVSFTLTRDVDLTASVFDVTGREVARLLDERRGAGAHDLVWDGRDVTGRELPSGVYIVRLQTELGIETVKVMLMR
jgi:flagellar hook assembly protein FlgD